MKRTKIINRPMTKEERQAFERFSKEYFKNHRHPNAVRWRVA